MKYGRQQAEETIDFRHPRQDRIPEGLSSLKRGRESGRYIIFADHRTYCKYPKARRRTESNCKCKKWSLHNADKQVSRGYMVEGRLYVGPGGHVRDHQRRC